MSHPSVEYFMYITYLGSVFIPTYINSELELLSCHVNFLVKFLHSCFFPKNSILYNSTFIHSNFYLFELSFLFFSFSLYSSIKLLVPYPCCIFLNYLFLSSVAVCRSSSNHVPLFAGSKMPSTSSAMELIIVLLLSHNYSLISCSGIVI